MEQGGAEWVGLRVSGLRATGHAGRAQPALLGNRGGHAHPAPSLWAPEAERPEEKEAVLLGLEPGSPEGASPTPRSGAWGRPRAGTTVSTGLGDARSAYFQPWARVLCTVTPNPQPSPETHLSVAQPGWPNCGSSRVGSCPRCCHSEAGAGRGAAHPYSSRTIGGEAVPALSLCSYWLGLPYASLQDCASPRPSRFFYTRKLVVLLGMLKLTVRSLTVFTNIKRKAKVILNE